MDDSIIVSYGARADEEAFRNILKQTAAVAIETFSPSDPLAAGRYQHIKTRVNTALSTQPGIQSIDHIVTDMAVVQSSINQTAERHEANQTLLEGLVADVEEVDIYEVSAQLLTLRTRLEASYQTSSILSRLSIVNYL